MRRTALIFGLLLTLTAGVWGGALASAASAWCSHEAGETSDAADAHDCCRARIGNSAAAHHSDPQPAPHDASTTRHERSNARNQIDQSHAGMTCDGAASASTTETDAPALGARGLSCADCCAGGSSETPATAFVVAPEQGKVKRDAASASVGARERNAPAPSHVSHLAPSQHAPPVPPDRRHILISVFLI